MVLRGSDQYDLWIKKCMQQHENLKLAKSPLATLGGLFGSPVLPQKDNLQLIYVHRSNDANIYQVWDESSLRNTNI